MQQFSGDLPRFGDFPLVEIVGDQIAVDKFVVTEFTFALFDQVLDTAVLFAHACRFDGIGQVIFLRIEVVEFFKKEAGGFKVAPLVGIHRD